MHFDFHFFCKHQLLLVEMNHVIYFTQYQLLNCYWNCMLTVERVYRKSLLKKILLFLKVSSQCIVVFIIFSTADNCFGILVLYKTYNKKYVIIIFRGAAAKPGANLPARQRSEADLFPADIAKPRVVSDAPG